MLEKFTFSQYPGMLLNFWKFKRVSRWLEVV